jgi:hypothetical protein
VSAWLREHVPGIERELFGLTAVRSGLPFEALFTQIWHEIFGSVTRDLARSGFTASARVDRVGYKGSQSVLRRGVVCSFQPG